MHTLLKNFKYLEQWSAAWNGDNFLVFFFFCGVFQVNSTLERFGTWEFWGNCIQFSVMIIYIHHIIHTIYCLKP